MTDPAPFRADLADGPDGGHAIWLRGTDGVRIRLSLWPEGPKGRILIFTGRTEYAEKYGQVVAGLARHGYGAMAVDWRGQGLSDRLADNPLLSHIPAFADYQKDVAAIRACLHDRGETAPLLLAHSMGGSIALRAMLDGMPLRAVAFSSPMWDINFPPWIRPIARGLGCLGRITTGLGQCFTPLANRNSYVLSQRFRGNLLTGHEPSYERMRRHLRQEPGFGLAGPSLRWLDEALGESRDLATKPAPDVPVLCILGTDEKVVDSRVIHDRIGNWPGAQLELFDKARHEVLMESDTMRDRAIALIAAHFDQATTSRTYS
ncbi:MAG: alpha/beta fold hydrolase [Pseudorhodobacter sp.]